jgi:endo-1,4-beta-xylanase
MFRFVNNCDWPMSQRRILQVLSLVLAGPLLCAASLHAQTIATYDFEGGNAQGWSSFYNATTPLSSNAAAYTGSSSLLTTTSSTGTGGPSVSLNAVLSAGATYNITGYVRLGSGGSSGFANFTMLRSDPTCSGGTCYDTIGGYKVAVSNSGWAQIGGTYTPSTTETGLTLYAQLVGATSAQSFYLDDVVITQTAPPPGGTPVATYTWIDGGTDGWFPFGSPKLTNTAIPQANGFGDTNALMVTNRTAGFMGPALDLVHVNNVAAGATYQVTAYVRLASPDSANPTASLTLKLADCATSAAFSGVGAAAAISDSGWTKLQGTFTFSNQPGPPSSLVLYVQSSSATDSFYISHVTIGELAPPPPNPSQQDNTGISTNFDDGGTDGWSSRSGSSSVTNSANAAHSGSNSLLTTGRIANWDGPAISVSNKMYPGSVYNVSGWVMLTPADNTSHVINVSLQTTLSGNTTYPTVTSYPGITVQADGKWHQVSVMGYNMASAYDQGAATLYFQTAPPSGTDTVSFYLDDFQITYVAPPSIQTDIPSIYQTLSSYFPVGTAVDAADLQGPHEQLMTMHFDSLTPGNEMKWSSVENSKGNFNFGPADAEVGVAVCNNMQIRGHNLVWATGAQTPSYAWGDGTNSAQNQAAVIDNIREHIQNEVQHFGSKVTVWDVVNEPLDPRNSDCLEHGPFWNVLGKSYLDVALQAARDFAPKGTKLFINDYSTTDPNRLACLVQVLADLKSRNIPIDGVGHEMHNAINYPSPAAVANAIDTIAQSFPDLDQEITELDESVYNAGDQKSNYGNSVPPQVLAEQGWLYADYFDVFRSRKIGRVTIWGMADDDTWLDSFPVSRTDYPLPFDMGLQAKPAYWGIVDKSKLPGYGLTLSSSIGAGQSDTRTITLSATNGDVGTAYATQINGLKLTQVASQNKSAPTCSPVVTAPSGFPINLGNLPASGTAAAAITVSFAGCNPNTQWNVSIPWSANTYETGTFMITTDFNRGASQ